MISCGTLHRRVFAFATPVDMRKLIRELYDVEDEIQGPFPGDAEAQRQRAQLRDEKSRPIMDAIYGWATTEVGLPQSDLGKAVRYLLKRWKALTRCLEDPQIPLDNNAAYAVHGIGGAMPRPGLCRVVVAEASEPWLQGAALSA